MVTKTAKTQTTDTVAKAPKKRTSTLKKAEVNKNKAIASKPSHSIQEQTNTSTPNVLSPDNLFKIWFEGWKKTFVLRGRSSRFELWTFMLFNSLLTIAIQLKCSYILSPRFLRNANNMGFSIDKIENYIITAEILLYIVMFVPLVPLASMLIRRMHDLNRLAWHNYLEPIFMGVVVLSMINIAINSLTNTDYAYIAMFLSACFIAILYGISFYSLKFLIMTMFYRGDKVKNNYGEPKYTDEEHEEKALNLSCVYFLFIITIGLLYIAIALI